MTERVVSPLQPYLPRLVLDWQRTTPDVLVREIDGSMVFVDVSGFTKMSERLARQGKVGAEEVSDVIGATFGALLAEAYACGGSLIKFGGDALLIFFQGDGHALRAVAAAHGMRAELRRSGTFSTTSGKVTLRMSVGAHTGRFHFFLVGGSHRELIVAGPAATETVTMEGAASAGQVLLSPALAAAVPTKNRGRVLGPGVLLAGDAPGVERTEIVTQTVDFGLQPFVSVALRETVLAGEVEPEHRSVAIAFVHYGGFDDLVHTKGADVASAALDTLVRSAQQAADAHGVAFLASDIAPDGGKIILTAGAPIVTGADEEMILLAARDLVTDNSGLPLHIGVNKGPVFAGAIGPPYRRTYTVMGDDVNLAARLMARAGVGEIVATPAVLDASRTTFETVRARAVPRQGQETSDNGVHRRARDRESNDDRRGGTSAPRSRRRADRAARGMGIGPERRRSNRRDLGRPGYGEEPAPRRVPHPGRGPEGGPSRLPALPVRHAVLPVPSDPALGPRPRGPR